MSESPFSSCSFGSPLSEIGDGAENTECDGYDWSVALNPSFWVVSGIYR